MDRRDLTLAMLAAAGGMPYSPVQLQKALFLVTRNVPDLVTSGPNFNFVPYDYGPFDASVYDEAANLSQQGEAVLAPAPYGRYTTYAATAKGLGRGTFLLGGLSAEAKSYIKTVSEWVREMTFAGLVKSIYEAYPEMRANSVFQG